MYDGEIGYCQGLSFIAAVLLLEVSNTVSVRLSVIQLHVCVICFMKDKNLFNS